MKHIVFITNPISGTINKANIPELVEKHLDHARFSYEFVATQYAGHAEKLAKEAAARGADMVCAIGGDGTVNEVGRSLVGTETAMAILPCGSGNGLARHLMLPMELKSCIDIINLDAVEVLDSGVINGHPFFCTCGMGFDAFISMKFAEAGKRGLMTYVEQMLREGLSYKPETYEIEDEMGLKIYKAFLISAANASQYGNNAYIAPHASMSDGLLDVIIMQPFSLIEAPQVALEMLNKTIDKNVNIRNFKARHVHIHRSHPGLIHYDGEPLMSEADVEISVKPQSIRIVVNPDADEAAHEPNVMQTAASELFYNMDRIRSQIAKQGRHIQATNLKLLRRLNLK